MMRWNRVAEYLERRAARRADTAGFVLREFAGAIRAGLAEQQPKMSDRPPAGYRWMESSEENDAFLRGEVLRMAFDSWRPRGIVPVNVPGNVPAQENGKSQ
jgi:hypothetical protein